MNAERERRLARYRRLAGRKTIGDGFRAGHDSRNAEVSELQRQLAEARGDNQALRDLIRLTGGGLLSADLERETAALRANAPSPEAVSADYVKPGDWVARPWERKPAPSPEAVRFQEQCLTCLEDVSLSKAHTESILAELRVRGVPAPSDAATLAQVQRYQMVSSPGYGSGWQDLERDPEGEWVRWDDVSDRLSTIGNARQAACGLALIEQERISRVMAYLASLDVVDTMHHPMGPHVAATIRDLLRAGGGS